MVVVRGGGDLGIAHVLGCQLGGQGGCGIFEILCCPQNIQALEEQPQEVGEALGGVSSSELGARADSDVDSIAFGQAEHGAGAERAFEMKMEFDLRDRLDDLMGGVAHAASR